MQDLQTNLLALKLKYKKPVIVAEYSQLKDEVNKIAFMLPGEDMKGTFIWEPLSTWESIFDKDGKSKELINAYDEISKEYKIPR